MDYRKIKEVLLKILFWNWLVAGAKIAVGFFSGSLSIAVDGIHSLADGASNIIGWVGIKMAEKPRDEDHPYGHVKFEAFVALGIVVFIAITAWEFVGSAFGRFFHPTELHLEPIYFLVPVACLIINFIVSRYQYRTGCKLNSLFLVADSRHTRSDLTTTSAVLLGMIAAKFGFLIFDPIAAFFVLVMLGKLAWEIIKDTSGLLCDRACIAIEEIQKVTNTIAGIRSVHQIRTRGSELFGSLDMHICVDPHLSVEEGHEIATKLKQTIMQAFPHIQNVVIHVEPEKN